MKPFNCVKINLFVVDNNNSNHLTVCKQMSSDSFKNDVTNKSFAYKPYIYIYLSIYIYIYKDLALNCLQELICLKTLPNKLISFLHSSHSSLVSFTNFISSFHSHIFNFFLSFLPSSHSSLLSSTNFLHFFFSFSHI